MGSVHWALVGFALVCGCGGLLRGGAGPLANYALLPDSHSDDAAWTDGDVATPGAPTVEAYVLLAESRVVRKVVVHSSEVLVCAVDVWDIGKSAWVGVDTKRNGPGKLTFDLKPAVVVTGVRARVLESVGDEALGLAAWEEAYRQGYPAIHQQIATRRGPAYSAALARRGFAAPRPYIDVAKEADLQARIRADEVVARAKREGRIRSPAAIEEIEVLGPPM